MDTNTQLNNKVEEVLRSNAKVEEILNSNANRWNWGTLTTVVLSFSILTVLINHFTFLLLPPKWIETNSSKILEGLNWSNKKLERIEKKLATPPKAR
jgi:hypothetical protein